MALHDVLDKIRIEVNQKQAAIDSAQVQSKDEQKVPVGGAGAAEEGTEMTLVEEQ